MGYARIMAMKKYIYILVGVVVLVGIIFVFMAPGKPGRLDAFATCIKDQGATFWGAFWCPHCQNQKTLFGKSSSKLPYVECSTPDGKGQLQVCKDAGVTTYPTWDFVMATSTSATTTTERMTGELALDMLASKTGCVLPE